MKSAHTRGFSLIELLASAAVVTLIMVLFSTLMGMVSKTWTFGKSTVDNSTQARATLSLIERDIQSMVIRPDVAAFVDGSGNAACAFYTQQRGFGDRDQRAVSLVQYELVSGVNSARFVRKCYDINFADGADGRTVALNHQDRLADLDSAEPQEMTEGVVGFQIQFLDDTGVIHQDFVSPNGERRSTALVSMAVLDSDTFRQVNHNSELEPVLRQLSGLPAVNQSYADYWESRMIDPAFANSRRITLRVYKRVIPIPIQAIFTQS